MIRYTLAAVALATLLTSSAIADDRSKHGDDDRNRSDFQAYRHDDRRDDDRRDGDYRYDRRWRHVPPAYYRGSSGYRAGYESGWREASRYCRFDYGPGRWYRDPRDSYWYFGFQIND